MKTGYFLNGPPVEVISAWGPFNRTTTNPASRARPRARRIACLWSGAGACGVTFPAPRLSLTRLVLRAPACASFLLSDWPSCHFSRPAPTSCVNTLAPICASHCVSWVWPRWGGGSSWKVRRQWLRQQRELWDVQIVNDTRRSPIRATSLEQPELV